MAYRLTSTRSSFFGYLTPGVKWLLISNTVVFVLYYLGGQAVQQNASAALGLVPAGVIKNLYVWQLFTYMFLHAGITHLLFNMLALWMFGSMLEQDWGTRRFVKYYFLCGIAAGVCVVTVNALMGGINWFIPTLGASGAIFGLLLAFGVMYPNQTVLMSFLFPIKAKYMVMIYAAIELLLTFGPNSGVSTVAHLGGMVFGYFYLKVRWPSMNVGLADARSAYNQWRIQRAKKKFQVYMRKHGKDGGPWVN
jgi:membrane associated rhomboid family serine protease